MWKVLMNFMSRKFVLLILVSYMSIAAAMDINDFFPDINGNLTKITWAHAVNNRTHLNQVLHSSVMMLEADVIYGKLNGTGEAMPIMGHPPANQSDLSLQDFLQTTYNFNKDPKNKNFRKGVKLDFKSTEVFAKSVVIIKKIYESIDYPLWLNADIISGPLHPSTTAVNASEFLSTARAFNKSVLSLGWTTTEPSSNTFYTDEQITNMVAAVKKSEVTQNITFAVRAGVAALSLDQMRRLESEIDNCTLTVWSSEGDKVDVAKLRDVIFAYGVKRVFVDVPRELYDRLSLGDSTSSGTSLVTSAVFTSALALFFVK